VLLARHSSNQPQHAAACSILWGQWLLLLLLLQALSCVLLLLSGRPRLHRLPQLPLKILPSLPVLLKPQAGHPAKKRGKGKQKQQQQQLVKMAVAAVAVAAEEAAAVAMLLLLTSALDCVLMLLSGSQ
jgi:hypothetical protein